MHPLGLFAQQSLVTPDTLNVTIQRIGGARNWDKH